MSPRLFLLYSVLSTTLIVSGCVSESGSSVNEGTLLPGSLIRTSTLTESELCPAGGMLIEVGTDTNKDGILQDEEVEQAQEICNGVSGRSSVVNATFILPGHAVCEYGGTQIDVGLDDGTGNIDPTTLQTEFVCRQTPDCTWLDNGNGTFTVTCDGEEPYLLLAQSSLEFTESIRCNIGIDKAGDNTVQIPLSYTIDKIGDHLKYVTLTVYDGQSQFTNSRLLSSGQFAFSEALINVFYDNYEDQNGGRFYAFILEEENVLGVYYQDPDLITTENSAGIVGEDFNALSVPEEEIVGVCTLVLPN